MMYAFFISAAFFAAQEAPAPIAEVNPPTESAKAVYLADEAAKERGKRSKIAVLGTIHLRNLPNDFDLARFAPLIKRLAAWAPERIAIESIPGPACDYLRAYAFAHEGSAERYCADPAPARTALGLSGPEAAEEIERILAVKADDRPAAERRRLAALFLAAGDRWSAVLQWVRLPETERTLGDGVTAELATYLTDQSQRKREDAVIAVPLAAALGHERIYPVDDQASGSEPADPDAYIREIQEIWNNDWAKALRAGEENELQQTAADPHANVLDLYRTLNSAERARLAVAADFGAAAGADTPHNTGRDYLAYWETRNLRMAANIRHVIGAGGRVLAIVGANHKAYYERYLGVTSDLEIVDMQELLK